VRRTDLAVQASASCPRQETKGDGTCYTTLMLRPERIPLIDGNGLSLLPPKMLTPEQVDDLALANLVRKCGRRWVTAAKLLPGTSLASVNAHLRRKISQRLPTAEDCQTVTLIGKTFTFIHVDAWSRPQPTYDQTHCRVGMSWRAQRP